MAGMRGSVNGAMGVGAALLSLFAGLGAVAASSCCALPLALSIAGFGGAWLGGASELVFYRPWFLTAAAVALAAGWTVVLRPRRVACAVDGRCARSLRGRLTLSVLTLATLLAGTAAGWGWIEPAVMAALFRLAEATA